MKTKFLMLALLVVVLASLLLSMVSCNLGPSGPAVTLPPATTTEQTPPRTQPASTTAAPVTQSPIDKEWSDPVIK
ncbi:MAG: hypothetical protein IJF73_06215 [Clostridia bacterium]|nr:hypothetical protein [Clostridia bacterium]